MKRSLLFLFTVAILASCAKSNKDPKPVPNPNAMKYKVHGVTDQEVSTYDSVVVPITVEHIDGNQEKLSLTVSDLPPGVTATITPANGIPDFNASIVLKAGKDAVVGQQSIKINTTTPLGANKSMDMALNVKPATGFAADVIGHYTGYYTTSTSSTQIPVDLYVSEVNPSTVSIFLPSWQKSVLGTLENGAMHGPISPIVLTLYPENNGITSGITHGGGMFQVGPGYPPIYNQFSLGLSNNYNGNAEYSFFLTRK